MTSRQYEELSRFFLAEQLGIPTGEIQSVHIANPRRPGLPEYSHQIDLYWEVTNDVALYINIANAKWRTSRKVEQREVLLLHEVKQKVSAHKAMMLTNLGFTSGAVAVAKHEGVALHIVQPAFDFGSLDPKNATVILEQIHRLAATTKAPLYSHQIVHRAFELQSVSAPTTRPRAFPNRAAVSVSNAALPPLSNRMVNPGTSPGGGAGSNSNPGGISTRQGLGPHPRMK